MAEQLLAAAREDAAQLEDAARAHADQQLGAAEKEAERVRYQAYGEAERLLGDVRGQVAELERTAARSAPARRGGRVRPGAGTRLIRAIEHGQTSLRRGRWQSMTRLAREGLPGACGAPVCEGGFRDLSFRHHP